jgi:CheY-like chemotaxis protein
MLNATIVIDDSESDRYLARRALNKAGVTHRVLEFPDALAALALLSDRQGFERECGPWPPRAVVLLDVNMPRMGGFEFLDALEQRIEAGEVRHGVVGVVMYSTSDCQSDVDRALSHGLVMDYMVKPITVEAAARIARIATSFEAQR